MRSPRKKKLIAPALALGAFAALGIYGTTAAMAGTPTAQAHAQVHAAPLMLTRPGADDPALRGTLAPITGTVPGLSGAATKKLVGPAEAAFRKQHATLVHAAEHAITAAPAPDAAIAQDATTIHNAWGVFPGDDGDTKMLADQSIVPGLTLSGQEYLYAPTLKAPDGSCVELTTAYTPDGAYLWAWDWCVSIDAAKTVPLDSTFVSTYTTTTNGHTAYSMYEAKTNVAKNTWTVYLYNYTTHSWNTFYSQSGTDQSGAPEGWDMFEVYTTPTTTGANGPYCSEISGDTFESSHIQIYNASTGGWHAASATTAPGLDPLPSGSDLGCSTLSFSVPKANSDWKVTN